MGCWLSAMTAGRGSRLGCQTPALLSWPGRYAWQKKAFDLVLWTGGLAPGRVNTWAYLGIPWGRMCTALMKMMSTTLEERVCVALQGRVLEG